MAADLSLLTDLARAAAAGLWSGAAPDPEACRGATDVIEAGDPDVRAFARALPEGSDWEVAAAAFERVRDGVRYDFAPDLQRRSDWRASATIARGHGFCQQKAVLLASVLRAAGIPAALAFENLFDAKIRPPFSELLGGQVLPWHGLVLAHVGGGWRRADACLDSRLCESRGYRVATFAPPAGGPLPLADAAGKPHFRTVAELMAEPDLPDAAVAGVMGLTVIHQAEWKIQARRRQASM